VDRRDIDHKNNINSFWRTEKQLLEKTFTLKNSDRCLVSEKGVSPQPVEGHRKRGGNPLFFLNLETGLVYDYKGKKSARKSERNLSK